MGRDEIFIQHIKAHLEPDQDVVCKICGKSAEQIINEALEIKPILCKWEACTKLPVNVEFCEYPKPARIKTLEGYHDYDPEKDVLIRGVKGELYPCKREIFRATYTTCKPASPDKLCDLAIGDLELTMPYEGQPETVVVRKAYLDRLSSEIIRLQSASPDKGELCCADCSTKWSENDPCWCGLPEGTVVCPHCARKRYDAERELNKGEGE